MKIEQQLTVFHAWLECKETAAFTLDLIALGESKLTPEQRDDFYYTHLHIKDEDHSWSVSASKEKRLAALLKAIGKWAE